MKKAFAAVCTAAVFAWILTAFAAADAKGDKLLQDISKGWKGVKDYKCTFSYDEEKDGKMSGGTYEFMFKQPGLFRLEVKAGEDKGSIVAYRPDKDSKVVQVKRGMMPPLTLKKTNPLIKDKPLFKTDFGYDVLFITDFAKSTGAAATVKGAGNVKGRSADILELAAKKGGEFTKVVVYVDKASKLPIQIDRYKGSSLWSRRVYWDLKVNTNFSADEIKI